MVQIDWKRLVITFIGFMLIDIFVGMLLQSIGINGIYLTIGICYVSALFCAFINYPKQLRKMAIKDPFFHRNVALYFLFFFLFDLLF